MKRYNYSIARNFSVFTGAIFFSQFILEVGGIITRKPGFECVLPICGGAFLCSVFYCLLLILLNARTEHNKEINRT